MAPAANPIFREIKQIATEVEAMARVLSNIEDAVVVGPIIRVAMERISINTTCMTQRQNSMVHLVVYAAVLIIPLSTATRENNKQHNINNIMEKMSISPHQQQQVNLYQ